MESLAYCEQCGARVSQHARFCSHCGSAICLEPGDEKESEGETGPIFASTAAEQNTTRHANESAAVPSLKSFPSGGWLRSRFFFVFSYLILIIPSYILPYFGSNSSFVNITSSAFGLGTLPMFWMHLVSLYMSMIVVWFRGIYIDKPWIGIFPFLAAVFDLTPGFNWFALLPTGFHVAAIIAGVSGDTSAAPEGLGRRTLLIAGISLAALIGWAIHKVNEFEQNAERGPYWAQQSRMNKSNSIPSSPATGAGTTQDVGFDLLKAEVTAIRFFEGYLVGREQRKYASRFSRSGATYINWELNLVHPAPTRRTDFAIDAVYYSPDGAELGKRRTNTFVDGNWTYSYHNNGWGWSQSGRWPVGTYVVRLSSGGKAIGSAEFAIVGDDEVAGASTSAESKEYEGNGPSQKAEIADAPVMREGDTYVVESVFPGNSKLNNTTERRVVSVSQNEFLLESRNMKSGYSRTITYTSHWNVMRAYGRNGEGFDYSPQIKYFDFPLSPGKSWQETSVERNSKTGATREHAISGRVGDWETVTVTAGTFRAIKVSLKDEVRDLATGRLVTKSEDVSWYSPDIKRSVKSEIRSVDVAEGTEQTQSIQVLRYSLQTP